MDKKSITLYELQLYVKSWGNSNNDRAKIFLENVFQIGFSSIYEDIFPMEEFEYGDLLVLDNEFIYKEYLKFLEKNESFDDVLFYIAENEYINFYEGIKYAYKPLEDIKSHFKTRKKLIEEEIERRKKEEIRKKREIEELKKIIEERKKISKKEESNSVSYSKNVNASDNMEMSMKTDFDSFFSSRDIYTPPETFKEKVQRQMGISINNDLQANIYARTRIEEHLKDIKKLKTVVANIFSE